MLRETGAREMWRDTHAYTHTYTRMHACLISVATGRPLCFVLLCVCARDYGFWFILRRLSQWFLYRFVSRRLSFAFDTQLFPLFISRLYVSPRAETMWLLLLAVWFAYKGGRIAPLACTAERASGYTRTLATCFVHTGLTSSSSFISPCGY